MNNKAELLMGLTVAGVDDTGAAERDSRKILKNSGKRSRAGLGDETLIDAAPPPPHRYVFIVLAPCLGAPSFPFHQPISSL